MRGVVVTALQVLILFNTLCESERLRDAPPTDKSDENEHEYPSRTNDSDYTYEYDYEGGFFCSSKRWNELVIYLPSECVNFPTDPLSIDDNRVRILCGCGEPGIELFTECYYSLGEVYDPFIAVCTRTVNGVPCHTAFNDTIEEIYNLELCNSEDGYNSSESMCFVPNKCIFEVQELVRELGCCAYSNFILYNTNISVTDLLWDVCDFPQSLAYVCTDTTGSAKYGLEMLAPVLLINFLLTLIIG